MAEKNEKKTRRRQSTSERVVNMITGMPCGDMIRLGAELVKKDRDAAQFLADKLEAALGDK